MSRSPISDDIIELMIALRERRPTDEEERLLVELLIDNPAAQELYIEQAWLWSELELTPLSASDAHRRLDQIGNATVTARADRTAARLPIALSIAAALLFTAAAVAIYVFAFGPGPSPLAPPAKPGPPIATLIESTGTVSYEDDFAYEGEEYASGVYAIESGSAQFMLRGNVSVRLRGATQIQMHNPMSVALERGSASFLCPPGSEGFTVHLPGGASVVDLGTEFAVTAQDDGSNRVDVNLGSVEVRTPSGRALRLEAPAAAHIADSQIHLNRVRNGGFERNAITDGPVRGVPAQWIVRPESADFGIQSLAGDTAFYWNEPAGTLTQEAIAAIEAPGQTVKLSATLIAVNVGAFDATAELALDGEPIPQAAATVAGVDDAGGSRTILVRYVTQPQDVGRSLGIRFSFRVARPAIQANLDHVWVEIDEPTTPFTPDHSGPDGPTENDAE